MINEQRPLNEIVEKLEAAWNNSDSVAWTALFADDADFIHVLGGHFHGRTEIECGHRTIFDSIYKGSLNRFKVEGVRFVRPEVAIVFIFTNLTWYLEGAEQHIQARPTLVAEKNQDGAWRIVMFQNTLATTDAVPTMSDTLARAHPIKGNPPIEK
jgi:uncharacterized protein (TIGR02246 family)